MHATPNAPLAPRRAEPIPVVMHVAALLVTLKLIVSVMQLTAMPQGLGLESPLRAMAVLLSLGLTVGAMHFWTRRDLRGFAAATLGLAFWSIAHAASFYVPALLGCGAYAFLPFVSAWNLLVLAVHVFLAGVAVVALAPASTR